MESRLDHIIEWVIQEVILTSKGLDYSQANHLAAIHDEAVKRLEDVVHKPYGSSEMADRIHRDAYDEARQHFNMSVKTNLFAWCRKHSTSFAKCELCEFRFKCYTGEDGEKITNKG